MVEASGVEPEEPSVSNDLAPQTCRPVKVKEQVECLALFTS